MTKYEFGAAWGAKVTADSNRHIARCGCAYEVFQRNFSFDIEVLLGDVPHEFRAEAISMAEDAGYLDRDGLAQLDRELKSQGLCSHGLEPDCCPMGCGGLPSG